MRRPIAVLDACVIAPMPIADTLLRMADRPSLFIPKWSDEILAEMGRTLVKRLGKTVEQAARREAAMRHYFPGATVRGHEGLIPQLRNHPKDRHVLAAALHSRADFLVTYNLRDFKPATLGAPHLIAIGPSGFLKLLYRGNRDSVLDLLLKQARAINEPLESLLSRLAVSAPEFVAELLMRRG